MSATGTYTLFEIHPVFPVQFEDDVEFYEVFAWADVQGMARQYGAGGLQVIGVGVRGGRYVLDATDGQVLDTLCEDEPAGEDF